MLRHELGEVRSTCHSTKSSPLKLGSSRAATCRRLARGGVGLVVRPAQERTVPVEQYLAGVGGRPLVAGAPGTRPRTRAPWPPVAMPPEPVGTRARLARGLSSSPQIPSK
jgi:hypothetical protein